MLTLSDADRATNRAIFDQVEEEQRKIVDLMIKDIRNGFDPIDVITAYALVGAEALRESPGDPYRVANLAIVGALYNFVVKPQLERENEK